MKRKAGRKGKSLAWRKGHEAGVEAVQDAYREAAQDGETFGPDDAAKWFAPGQMLADEALVNAMGADDTATCLGVAAPEGDAWSAALAAYNAGFQAGAEEQAALVPCDGPAHSNPYIDHCMVCAPRWGWMRPRKDEP